MDIDKKLILKCKSYDKAAFMELYKKYERYLYSICYSYTQSEQDSLDIIQEIYIKIFKNIGSFNIEMPFHPWVRRITVNTCLNFKRSLKNNVISLNQEYEGAITIEENYASDINVENEIEKMEFKRFIKDRIRDLPENYRLVITLRYYEELSYQEISELINKPLGTVKTDIYRAKSILRKQLEEKMEG